MMGIPNVGDIETLTGETSACQIDVCGFHLRVLIYHHQGNDCQGRHRPIECPMIENADGEYTLPSNSRDHMRNGYFVGLVPRSDSLL